MKRIGLILLRLLQRNGAGIVATAAFGAIAVGLWWERPSLALIVPGTIVFCCLAVSHVLGVKRNA